MAPLGRQRPDRHLVALQGGKQATFLHDLEQFWIDNNLATNSENHTLISNEYLMAFAMRRWVWLFDRRHLSAPLCRQSRMGGEPEASLYGLAAKSVLGEGGWLRPLQNAVRFSFQRNRVSAVTGCLNDPAWDPKFSTLHGRLSVHTMRRQRRGARCPSGQPTRRFPWKPARAR